MIKSIATLLALLLGLGAGYQLFVSQPRADVSALESGVSSLEQGVQEEPEEKMLSREEITQKIEESAASAGIVIEELNFIDRRAEVVTRSSPVTVARFAKDVSKGPLAAISLSGNLLPQTIVTVVPRRG